MEISGINKKIDGDLLSRVVNDQDEIGFVYERFISYKADYHSHNWHTLSFPRSPSIINYFFPNTSQTITVDHEHFLWFPSGCIHKQEAISPVWDNFALFIKSETFKKKIKEYHLSCHSSSLSLLDSPIIVKKSFLIKEMVDDVFLGMVIKKHEPSKLMVNALMQKIIMAIMEKGEVKTLEQDMNSATSTILTKALDYIEGNLFKKLSSSELAFYAQTSIATLFRYFEKELKCSPYSYIRTRRIEEAKKLLLSGRYNVKETAYLVGYEDLGAFSKAFKKQIGQSPSKYFN